MANELANHGSMKTSQSRMCALNLKSKWKIILELDDIIQHIGRAIDDESLNLEKVNLDEVIGIINYAEMLYPDWSIKHALKQISDCNEGIPKIAIFGF